MADPHPSTPEIQTFDDYSQAYARSLEDPKAFWGEVAERFHWFKPWREVLLGGFERVDFHWFNGGVTNLAYNCLDRHLDTLGEHTALLFEDNDPHQPTRRYTYRQLYQEVNKLANALKHLGVKKGDRVGLYLPNVPEAAMAMLACARIGAIHSVVFGGFSAQALAARLNDAQCKVLLTADSTYRGTKEVLLKDEADKALEQAPSVQSVLVLAHTGRKITWRVGRDYDWAQMVGQQPPECLPEPMEAEDPLFILYTSGSTGSPKGVLHTTGGYMVYVGYTLRNVFQTRPDDVYWCTADVGWITGHSYLVYGPLLNGLTTVLFEGVPTWPDAGRFWQVVDKLQVNLFYTAPTAIRALMLQGVDPVRQYRLDSLRVLGSVGEPINQEAWDWYHREVGRGQCPLVDTWWQTETGGMLIAPLAGLTPERAAYATLPLPGVEPVLVDSAGHVLTEASAEAQEGNLCINRPWPGLARTTWGNHARYVNTYFGAYPGRYFTGDGARRDPDGYYRITGRVDDVINVSGHRIGTAEVEDALNLHPAVVESAVVGMPHPVKGQGICAFLTCSQAVEQSALEQELNDLIKQRIGPIAKPDRLLVVEALPKTRSGKIMRRILRKLAAGEADKLGDTSTLLDPSVVEALRQQFEAPGQ